MVCPVFAVAFFGYLLNSVANVLAVSGPGAKRTEAIKEKLQASTMQCASMLRWSRAPRALRNDTTLYCCRRLRRTW